jgi:hypothetical protein
MRLVARIGLGICFAVALTGAASAQQNPVAGQTRYRGTLDSVKDRTVGMTTLTGQHITVVVPPQAPVAAAKTGSLTDITPGSFIGSAARSLPDGTLEALEVHVFSPELRGTREGHYAWDLKPESTMTNGSVAEGQAVGTSGRKLTVNYAGGQKTIIIPPDMQVVDIVPGDWSDMKPGAPVLIATRPASDGTLTAIYVTVGRNGVRPPM